MGHDATHTEGGDSGSGAGLSSGTGSVGGQTGNTQAGASGTTGSTTGSAAGVDPMDVANRRTVGAGGGRIGGEGADKD